jgi:putative FmdB family regulatory protein
MPIYEYHCVACGHRTDILHGVHDAGPHFCPECGADGTMRKAFAAPAVHFKGSGWAKKERRAGAAAKADRTADAGADSATGSSTAATDTPVGAEAKPAEGSSD